MSEKKLRTFYLTFILLILLSASCGKKKKEVVIPGGVLGKEQMAQVLADVHLVEASINLRNVGTPDVRVLNASLYKEVFVKHHITEEVFENSYTFYSNNTDLFNEVYDKVIIELTQMQAKEEKKK